MKLEIKSAVVVSRSLDEDLKICCNKLNICRNFLMGDSNYTCRFERNRKLEQIERHDLSQNKLLLRVHEINLGAQICPKESCTTY